MNTPDGRPAPCRHPPHALAHDPHSPGRVLCRLCGVHEDDQQASATWLERALAGEIVIDIGQLTAGDVRELNRAVRRDRLVKWRGHWWPKAGASHGIGPLKTCWSVCNPYDVHEQETRPC